MNHAVVSVRVNGCTSVPVHLYTRTLVNQEEVPSR